jgi:hypothetical protein
MRCWEACRYGGRSWGQYGDGSHATGDEALELGLAVIARRPGMPRSIGVNSRQLSRTSVVHATRRSSRASVVRRHVIGLFRHAYQPATRPPARFDLPAINID